MVWSKRSPESGCGRSISTVVSPTARWTGGRTSRLVPMAMTAPSARRIELRWLRFSIRTRPSSSSTTRIWSLDTYEILKNAARDIVARRSAAKLQRAAQVLDVLAFKFISDAETEHGDSAW